VNRTAVAPDGSPVALYLALPGDDEAAVVHDAIAPGAAILELGSGPGRVTRPLLVLGHPVTAVDNSPAMLAHLPDEADAVLSDIQALDLGARRWPVVLLASHAINDPLGPALLAAGARHLAADGCLLVQRHEPGWVDQIDEVVKERDGVGFGITGVAHPAPGTVTATMVYVVDGQRYEQPFTAHEVDDDDLADVATDVGLRIDAVLDDARTWVRLVPRVQR